jgi:DNA-binding transcriptional LysR family regulator
MAIFSGLEAFVHTAEKRSFREAARQLGISPAAISKAVAGLEAELGVRLLNRTSRHVTLTPEGEIYLRHCREALDRLLSGRDQIINAAQVVQGKLKISMSFVLGRPVIGALYRLLSRYPGLQVQLSFSDLAVNLVEEEVDIAVRIGELTDSALVARKLKKPRLITLASPTYLARAGVPESIEALKSHSCLQFMRPNGVVAEWHFAGGVDFTAERPLLLDHGDLIVDAATAGLGCAQVFDFMAAEALKRGELVEIFPDQVVEGPPISALCLAGRQRVPKIRAFLEFITDVLGERA